MVIGEVNHTGIVSGFRSQVNIEAAIVVSEAFLVFCLLSDLIFGKRPLQHFRSVFPVYPKEAPQKENNNDRYKTKIT